MSRNPVSVIIKSLGLGGAERLIVDSLPYLDRSQFDYRFAYIVPWKNTMSDAVADAGFQVTCLGERKERAQGRNATREFGGYAAPRSLQSLALLPRAYLNL